MHKCKFLSEREIYIELSSDFNHVKLRQKIHSRSMQFHHNVGKLRPSHRFHVSKPEIRP